MYKYEDIFTSSSDYASRFAGDIGSWFLNVQNKAILASIGDKNLLAGQWLDIGGGHGQLQEIANTLGCKYLMLASHLDAFKNLQARGGAISGTNNSGIVSDLLELPFKDHSFKIVSSVRLLSHCDNWKLLISEMCRVSSNQVVIDYPPILSSNLMYSMMFPLKKLLEGNTRTFTIFSHKEIQNEFAKHGFKLTQKIGQFFWPMVLHRKIKSVKLANFLERLTSIFRLDKLFGNPTIAVFRKI